MTTATVIVHSSLTFGLLHGPQNSKFCIFIMSMVTIRLCVILRAIMMNLVTIHMIDMAAM